MILLSANSGFDDFSFSELNALEQEKCERFYFVENRNFGPGTFRFFTKISIFHQNFDCAPKLQFVKNFDFCP